MIDKIQNNQLRDIMEQSAAQQPDPVKAPSSDQADASVQVDYAALLEMAKQVPQTDDQAVQKAQELLLSGQLESTENIQTAAENIAQLGIWKGKKTKY